jgi:hypothetical protein
MTRHVKISLIAALVVLGAASPSLAGPTDGSRQAVSPTTWAEQTPEPGTRPYALTGSEKPKSIPTGWRRSVQRLGDKVQIDRFDR